METNQNQAGFRSDFLGDKAIVDFPKLPEPILKKVAQRADGAGHILDYQHYSVIMDATRRLPLLSVANIDGSTFNKIPRKEVGNNWKLDPRISSEHQLGKNLYKADKSDFDRGHMTKREDVQWGETEEQAKDAARSTFYYTNAVPQHAGLNQREWRVIEDYILHDEAITHSKRISVFTAPLLHESDPNFVTPVDNSYIKIPILFWKVVYFTKSDDQLYRVSFLYGQKTLLEEAGIVHITRDIPPVEDLFMDFEDAKTYQVTTSVIEQLTGFQFSSAIDPYQNDSRPIELIMDEVDVRGEEEIQLRGLVL